MYSSVNIFCCRMFLELQLSIFCLSGLLGVFNSDLDRFEFVPKGDLEGPFFFTK